MSIDTQYDESKIKQDIIGLINNNSLVAYNLEHNVTSDPIHELGSTKPLTILFENKIRLTIELRTESWPSLKEEKQKKELLASNNPYIWRSISDNREECRIPKSDYQPEIFQYNTTKYFDKITDEFVYIRYVNDGQKELPPELTKQLLGLQIKTGWDNVDISL